MHLNTHDRTINVECLHAQGNEYHHGDDAFDDVPAHSSDAEGAGPLPNNDLPLPLPRRIEHPRLNGMFSFP